MVLNIISKLKLQGNIKSLSYYSKQNSVGVPEQSLVSGTPLASLLWPDHFFLFVTGQGEKSFFSLPSDKAFLVTREKKTVWPRETIH